MTPRERECLQIIRRHEPIARADIAVKMGCSRATVNHYVWQLRCERLIEPLCRGRHSKWRMAGGKAVPTPKPPPPPPPRRELPGWRLRPIEQCPSVWAYAARCALEVRR